MTGKVVVCDMRGVAGDVRVDGNVGVAKVSVAGEVSLTGKVGVAEAVVAGEVAVAGVDQDVGVAGGVNMVRWLQLGRWVWVV